MDFFSMFITLAISLGMTWADDDPCFTFNGNGFLKFHLRNNNNNAHFSLKFSTVNPHGLLMFSEGSYGDDEALYMRDGKLAYHLFNTSPTGVEGYYGAFFQGDQVVNTGETITVHVYRNFNVTDVSQRSTRAQTGLIYKVGGRTYTHVDHNPRQGIELSSDVYIGGYKESLSATVGNYTGQISGVREEKNGITFINFSLNRGGVEMGCLTDFTPV